MWQIGLESGADRGSVVRSDRKGSAGRAATRASLNEFAAEHVARLLPSQGRSNPVSFPQHDHDGGIRALALRWSQLHVQAGRGAIS